MCETCKYFKKEDGEYPCCECKNTAVIDSDEFKRRPFLYESIYDKDVKLIAGMLSNGKINYWSCDFAVNIDDAVLVNNRSAYDVVKVVGVIRTTEEHVKRFTDGATLKKAVSVINIPQQEEG